MEITTYQPERARDVADLFHRAVHAIDPRIYTLAQQEAWAPTPPDYAFWEQRLAIRQPWIAMDHGRLVGFVELEPGGHIDCLYVDPDCQRQGVAGLLYERVEAQAQSAGLARLYVEASKIARPFFEHRGFRVLCRNEIRRHGHGLVNFTMEKQLSSGSSS
ncbi:MAG: GNAT family N-acetyltransferase [Oceanospirillaceae bacterium]|nr:GNAT family N-acetyltransferase [Oceanospirillaceae bacterium]